MPPSFVVIGGFSSILLSIKYKYPLVYLVHHRKLLIQDFDNLSAKHLKSGKTDIEFLKDNKSLALQLP